MRSHIDAKGWVLVSKAGSRSAVAVRHVPFEDLGLLTPLLHERGYSVSYVEAGLDDVAAPAVVDADLLIVLGGPIGVADLDRYPFLREEVAVIRDRLDRHAPTLGICLGAQLMAAALGADVGAGTSAEIGFAPIALTVDGAASALAAVADVPVLHWHGDRFQTPDPATRLAATDHTPDQAFGIGSYALALQFHLEADHLQIERWLIGHAHELAAHGIDPRTIRADALSYGPALAAAARSVFAGWLDGWLDGGGRHG